MGQNCYLSDMKNHDAQYEIQKQHRERQEKFVYYQIALCVTAIGFSVVQTIDQKLDCSHIFIAASVFFWVTSIFCGFQFIQIVLLALWANNRYFETIAGRVGNVSPSQEVEKVAAQILREKAEKYSKRSQRNFSWQQYFFYAGLASFVTWHIIQMTTN